MADGAAIHRAPTETTAAAEGAAVPTRLDAVRELRRPAAEGHASPIVAMPANSPRREWKRPLSFALLPLALVAGGYFYVTGGQIMSTDNAYVQADMVGVSTDVPGTVGALVGAARSD